MEEIFRIVESSGKVYRIYGDGRIEGFESGAVVVNRIPMLISEARHTVPDSTEEPSAPGTDQRVGI